MQHAIAGLPGVSAVSFLLAAEKAKATITSSVALPQADINEWADNAAEAAANCCTPSTVAGQTLTREIAGKIVSSQIQATKPIA